MNGLNVRQEVPFAMVPNALLKSDASGAEKLLYTVLAAYANAEKECWPSMETLARLTGTGKTTVARSIKSLSSAGWITVKKERIGESFKNVYRLMMVLTVPEETVETFHGTGEALSTVPPGTGRRTNEQEPLIFVSDDGIQKGDVRQITDFYQRSYQYEYRYTEAKDAKPDWNGKIVKLVKADIKRLGVELLGQLIEDFFADKPAWVVQNGTGLGYNVFHSCLDKLIERKAAPEKIGNGRLA